MATRSKTTVTKKPAAKTQKTTKSKRRTASKTAKKLSLLVRARQRVNDFMRRRPHRSFRISRRHDYKRSLAIPGYWSLTTATFRILRQNKKVFLLLGLTYALLSTVLLGLGSQDKLLELQQYISQAGQELSSGNWSDFGTAVLLSMTTITGAISPSMTEAQQIYAVLLFLLVWLTTVWLLRQNMAGHAIRLRDGLYNAGSPIVATALVALILALQLLPVAIVMVGYAAAQASGLLHGGVEAMLFWMAALGLSTLSLYWITGTFVAMVLVTLPGMYPLRAIQLAGDIVVGRRLRILYRLLWALILTAVVWIIVLLPTVLLDMGLKHWLPILQWLPIVPLVVAALGTLSLIWTSSYVYLLYRKVVEDGSKPVR